MLDELLKVKRLREDEAEKEWIKAKEQLSLKMAEEREKKHALEDYKIWRKQEENRLYEKIVGRNISQPKLAETREEIGLLKQKQMTLHQELLDSQEAVAQARQTVQAAKEKHLEASKKVLKYEELDTVEQKAKQREGEYKQEVETEDLQIGKH